jgi:GNAT superfamily N-acetyltransferase
MGPQAIKKITDKLFKRGLVIRSATTEDLMSLTMLLGELFKIESDFSPNIRKQRQGLASLMENGEATVLVAVMKAEIIGMCTLQPLLSTAEGGTVGMVEDLVVSEQWRKKGLGGLLLAEIEKRAVSQNMSRLQLFTDKENDPAACFYDKHEWAQTNMAVRRKKIA